MDITCISGFFEWSGLLDIHYDTICRLFLFGLKILSFHVLMQFVSVDALLKFTQC